MKTKLNIMTIALMMLITNISIGGIVIKDALKIKVKGQNYADESVVRFLPDATDAFDKQYEAHKLFSNNPNVPSIYTETKDHQLLCIGALSSLTETKEVTMFTRFKKAGNYSLQSIELGAFESDVEIELEDMNTGDMVAFADGANYSFDVDKSMLNKEIKFSIHFKKSDQKNKMMAKNNSLVLPDIDTLPILYADMEKSCLYDKEVLVILEDQAGQVFYSKVAGCSGFNLTTVIDPYNVIPEGDYTVIGTTQDKKYYGKNISVIW